MSELKIINGEFSSVLPLDAVPAIRAGYPSLAADYQHEPIDFNRDMIKHPSTSFYAQVRGDSMIDAGIKSGDLVIVDRSLFANNGDVVVAFINGEFTIKYFDDTHKEEGYVELVPGNEKYQPIKISAADQFFIWGVVTWHLHKWKD